MVTRDPFDNNTTIPAPGPAPYLDRFFANVIDALILVPMISLFTSGITSDLRWAVFSKNAAETYSLLGQYMFIAFSLYVLYEVLFVYFHSATPGHRFLHLKVITDDGARPTFFQIFFRSVFKFQAIALACIPFIEIAVRPDRRTFYDRLSQTRIASLKSTEYDQIHPEFRRIIVRWAYSLVAMVFLIVGMLFYKTVTRPNEGKTVKATAKSKCTESLDYYLRNYLSKGKESESLNCARELSEQSIEKSKSPSAFNYLTLFVVTPNDDLKDSYKKKYCDSNAERLLCKKDVAIDFDSIKPDQEDVINLLVELNQALAKDEHQRVFAVLDVLYTHVDWNKNLELYYLTSYVFLNESGKRSPASVKVSKTQWENQKSRFLKRMSVTQ